MIFPLCERNLRILIPVRAFILMIGLYSISGEIQEKTA
jgi:hypothetical protein